MSGDPRLEDRLARLGRDPAHDVPAEARKQGIKARLFGDAPPPRRIGRFLDHGLLGRGAMGTVRRAYDERLAREVAIKLVSNPAARQHHDRLLREAQALAKLSHPNVVQIYEAGELDGEIFIAMELVDGTPLDAWRRECHPWRECLHVYLQAGRGLAAAHEAGLVHRDFKPSNCIRDTRGRVRVLDFGLARALDLDEPLDGPSPASTIASQPVVARSTAPSGPSASASASTNPTMLQVQLTATHTVMGTLAYMAPEQFAGKRADARSDQFSFCVALHEALFGTRPFGEDPRSALLEMLHGSTAPAPAFPPTTAVPAAVRQALRRGLAADPAARWPSMDALLCQLEGALRPARWSSPLLLGVLTVSTALVTAAMIHNEDPCTNASTSLEAAWNDERRDGVRKAMLDTGVPYAEATWNTVQGKLDDYAQTLEGEQLSTCRANSLASNGSESPFGQQRCLNRRQRAFEHAVELLASGDPVVVEHAVALVTALPPVEECSDLDDSRSSGTDSDDRQAQELADDLDRARNSIAAGRHDEALATASKAAMEAEALGNLLLHGEALLVEGRALMGAGRSKEARAKLKAASTAGLQHGRDELVVAANANLIEVVGIHLAEHDRGLAHADLAVNLAARSSVRPRTHAVALTAHGNLSTILGELALAQEQYEHALKLLRSEQGDDSLALVEPLDGLATVLRQQGELGLALERRNEALELLEAAHGEQHPDTVVEAALTKANLAAILYDQGEIAEAQRQLEEAIPVLERALGPDHPSLADSRSSLGAVLDEQGDHARADTEHRQAIRIWEQALGPHHPKVATARYNLASSLVRHRQLDAAIAELELALGILRRNTPNKALVQQSANVLRELGRCHRERGDLVTAEAHYREGIALLEQSDAEPDSTTAGLLKGLARVVLARGDAPQAEQLYRRALALYQQANGPETLEVAHTHRHLAQVLAEQSRWTDAEEHVDRATLLYEHHGPAGEAYLEDARALRERIANHR